MCCHPANDPPPLRCHPTNDPPPLRCHPTNDAPSICALLLSFVLDVPDSLVRPEGGMSVQGHIKLINHQLRQIRSALALAFALGRKLILPPVVCGYDKAWYQLGSHGEFGGAPPFVVPIFQCPLDHCEPRNCRTLLVRRA